MNNRIVKIIQLKKNSILLHNHSLLEVSVFRLKIQLDSRQAFLMFLSLDERIMFHFIKPYSFQQAQTELLVNNLTDLFIYLFICLFIYLIIYLFIYSLIYFDKSFTMISYTFNETYNSFLHMNRIIQSLSFFTIHSFKFRSIL